MDRKNNMVFLVGGGRAQISSRVMHGDINVTINYSKSFTSSWPRFYQSLDWKIQSPISFILFFRFPFSLSCSFLSFSFTISFFQSFLVPFVILFSFLSLFSVLLFCPFFLFSFLSFCFSLSILYCFLPVSFFLLLFFFHFPLIYRSRLSPFSPSLLDYPGMDTGFHLRGRGEKRLCAHSRRNKHKAQSHLRPGSRAHIRSLEALGF